MGRTADVGVRCSCARRPSYDLPVTEAAWLGGDPERQTHVILRRSGWASPAELEQAAARSTLVGDEQMPAEVRWLRSYVLEEGGGSVGTVCVYQATSPEAIRRHAKLADLPVDEIVAAADTVVVRPDPEPATA